MISVHLLYDIYARKYDWQHGWLCLWHTVTSKICPMKSHLCDRSVTRCKNGRLCELIVAVLFSLCGTVLCLSLWPIYCCDVATYCHSVTYMYENTHLFTIPHILCFHSFNRLYRCSFNKLTLHNRLTVLFSLTLKANTFQSIVWGCSFPGA